ncbi:MAG TPA: hypothetical protein P5560_04830 [Thermotogota bacterium]|nr:hypothetical protein [Thermotogota bacterium]HRW92260.1 hypothetical protein [Thermotogota bacterium]
MRKILVLSWACLLVGWMLGYNATEAWEVFRQANSLRDAGRMQDLVQQLELQCPQDPSLYTVLASCLFRYADWGNFSKSQRKEWYTRAVSAGDKAVEVDESDPTAHYALGLASGRLAELKGLTGLGLLKDFEFHLQRTLELVPEHYLALYALAMRYRDAPWPMKDLDRAEDFYLRSLASEPGYLNASYDLALLYLEQKRPEKAIPLLEFVVHAALHPDWTEESRVMQQLAREELETLR